MPDVFNHEVLFYSSPEEFLAGTVAFLRGGLEAEEPAMVAVRKEKADLVAGELGGDAASVRFVPIEDVGRNPARIIPFWREFVGDPLVGRPVRGIGEPIWPGRSGAEIDECQRHESLLNHAFATPPAWRLLCPYDTAALPDDVIEAADACHRSDGSDGPFDGSLEARPGQARSFDFDRRALHEVRGTVAEEAARRGLEESRSADLVTASSELAANSILHGGGRGRLAIWTEDDSLLVEVEDDGWIEDPMAGRLRPDPTQVSGRGLWLANNLCDLVQIRSGPGGTTARLHMSLSESSSDSR